MNIKSIIQFLEDRLANLPSVGFKVIQLAILDALTLAWGVALCFIKDMKDTVAVYNAWLFFLAALHGVNLGAFVAAVRSPTTSPSGLQLGPDGRPIEDQHGEAEHA